VPVFTACIGQGGNSWKNISEKNLGVSGPNITEKVF
jgi:hypothetical protein